MLKICWGGSPERVQTYVEYSLSDFKLSNSHNSSKYLPRPIFPHLHLPNIPAPDRPAHLENLRCTALTPPLAACPSSGGVRPKLEITKKKFGTGIGVGERILNHGFASPWSAITPNFVITDFCDPWNEIYFPKKKWSRSEFKLNLI